MNSLEAFELLKTLIENVNEKTNSLTQQLSQYDLEQQDILHFIENKKLNAAQISKVFKLLKQIRENRRNTKNELSRYTSLASKMSNKSNLLECKLELKPEEEFYELRTDVLNYDFGFASGSRMYFGEIIRMEEIKEIPAVKPLIDSHVATPAYVDAKIEEALNEDGSDENTLEAIMEHPEGKVIILTNISSGRVKNICNFEKAVMYALGNSAHKLQPAELVRAVSRAMKALKSGNKYLGYKWEIHQEKEAKLEE